MFRITVEGIAATWDRKGFDAAMGKMKELIQEFPGRKVHCYDDGNYEYWFPGVNINL